MEQPLIKNKVAESGIITLDLEAFYPKEAVIVFDIKEYLFMEMILKEKDFRAALKERDWKEYKSKIVGIVCSADAIIPLWAYMLIVTYLQPMARYVAIGNQEEVKKKLLLETIKNINPADYQDARVVIKGCGDIPFSEEAYTEISLKLVPVVKSLMYGEPCSTVPVFKRK